MSAPRSPALPRPYGQAWTPEERQALKDRIERLISEGRSVQEINRLVGSPHLLEEVRRERGLLRVRARKGAG